MHRLINFDSIFYGCFGCLYKTDFSLILFLLFGAFLQVIELSYGYTSFFDTFFPDFKLLIFKLLLSFSLFLFFFHSEYLI